MRKSIALVPLFIFLIIVLFNGCSKDKEKVEIEVESEKVIKTEGKKVYFLDSYHKDFQSRVLTRDAFEDSLKGSGVEIRYEFLDAKNIKESSKLEEKALQIKELVDEWEPDCIVAADDAINKYLISPYYKGTDTPVVFIGVNWDATAYGYPDKNITGQIEVELFSQLIETLTQYSKGEKIGILTGDTMTDKKNIEEYKKILKDSLTEIVLVDNYENWKQEFINLQDKVDILILRHRAGISNWDEKDCKEFVELNTKVPTGTVHLELQDIVLACYPKLDDEYGVYAGETVLDILKGKSPSDIPITKNYKSKIILNMGIAKVLNIKFPSVLLEIATPIGFKKKKVLYINSYHSGYEWSDDIEVGLKRALNVEPTTTSNREFSSGVIDLKIYRMDTKLNQSEDFKRNAALTAKSLIESWKPDIVLVSDDNAAKYLVSEYFLNSNIPILFCGVNWNASEYGFPTNNISGMVEIAPYMNLLEELKKYSNGNRVGILRSASLSSKKEAEYIKEKLAIEIDKDYIAETYEEWKKAYIKLQKEVDQFIIFSQVGIINWNEKEAIKFVLKNSKIPCGSALKNTKDLSLISYIRIPEEQGWWIGKNALDYFNGKSIRNIPIAENKESSIYLNMKLARKLKVVFSMELINEATLIE